MKKIILLLAFTGTCGLLSGKVWRVNNVPGIVADFTTAQTAHDNANVLPGDSIYLEPSTTSYGTLTMTKRLTIISVGDFLTSNPGVQYALISGRISTLTITAVSAANSVFHCNFTSAVSISNASNIRFERCHVEGALNFNGGSNNVVIQNYLYAASFSNSSNNVIANNIIEYYLDVNSTASATVVNNVLFAQLVAGNRPMQNSSFQNNILNKIGSFAFTNTVVENNIAANASLPAGNGNQNNVTMTNVFVNANGTTDVDFVLQTNGPNPAIGTGSAGVNCGAYGGVNPFKPGLQAAIPAIYKLTAPATPSGSTMNITFSTRSNN